MRYVTFIGFRSFYLGAVSNKEIHSDLPSLSQLHYLDKGVSAVGGLFGAEGFGHTLSVGPEGTMGQTGPQ